MFCPRCGSSDQSVNSYCRKCGAFLPDFDAIKKKETPVNIHLAANTVLSIMTVIASFALAATLYAVFFGRADTHIVIYITAGFLIAIGCWNIQTAYRTLMLKKRLKATLPESDGTEMRSLPQPSASGDIGAWQDLRTKELER